VLHSQPEEPRPIDTTRTLEDLEEEMEPMLSTRLLTQDKEKDTITQLNNV